MTIWADPYGGAHTALLIIAERRAWKGSFIAQEEEEEGLGLSELALFFFAQFGDGLFGEKRAHSIKGILVIQTKYSCFLCERVNELVTWRAGIHGGRRLETFERGTLKWIRPTCLRRTREPCFCLFSLFIKHLRVCNDLYLHIFLSKTEACSPKMITDITIKGWLGCWRQHLDLNQPLGSFDLKGCNFNIYIINKKAKRKIRFLLSTVLTQQTVHEQTNLQNKRGSWMEASRGKILSEERFIITKWMEECKHFFSQERTKMDIKAGN